MVDGRRTNCELKNVLLIPDLGYQLLWVATLAKSGLKTSFHSGSCIIKQDLAKIATGTMVGNLDKLENHLHDPACSTKALAASSLELWHQRLAHAQTSVTKEMEKHGAVTRIQVFMPRMYHRESI